MKKEATKKKFDIIKIRERNRKVVLSYFGGERGIRTPGAVLVHTRFPIVRLRPAQPSLQKILNSYADKISFSIILYVF